jgi:hypothetical protein
VNVDFGGLRGWENTFHNTIPVGGAGPWFTFGRAYWWMNTANPVLVPAAVPANGQAPSVDASQEAQSQELARDVLAQDPTLRFDQMDPDGTALAAANKQATHQTDTDTLGEHHVNFTFNFEPSLRLKIYQFDPLHHDEAVFSVH